MMRTIAKGDATATVRLLVGLARNQLAAEAEDQPVAPDQSPLDRVARLQDQLHVAGEQVAHLAVDPQPVVDPDQLVARWAAHRELTAEQLLFRLDLTAERLVAMIEPLSEREWHRTCRVGDRSVTLGELVAGMLERAREDLLATEVVARLRRPRARS
jgi:hypothetical protein